MNDIIEHETLPAPVDVSAGAPDPMQGLMALWTLPFTAFEMWAQSVATLSGKAGSATQEATGQLAVPAPFQADQNTELHA